MTSPYRDWFYYISLTLQFYIIYVYNILYCIYGVHLSFLDGYHLCVPHGILASLVDVWKLLVYYNFTVELWISIVDSLSMQWKELEFCVFNLCDIYVFATVESLARISKNVYMISMFIDSPIIEPKHSLKAL